jgi:photosystem II stability/assembly factor-like uncharacterized protein
MERKMRTLKISLLVFILTITVSAQWYQQNSGVLFNLNSIFFIDANIGWSVGDEGIIIKTTDGGNIWITQAGVTTDNLYSVYFIDSNTGWIVGEDVRIMKSTDGGSNWILQIANPPFPVDLHSVQFLDLNNGWAVGNDFIDSYLIQTTNGGTSWQNNIGFMDEKLFSVFFVNNNLGLLSGSEIFRTSDAGNNWDPVFGSSFLDVFYSVFFIDESIGWFAGKSAAAGVIYKSTNGGLNWNLSLSDSFKTFTSVHFSDLNNGWVSGFAGNIFNTSNGGTNWTMQVSGTNSNLNSIFFINNVIGWTAGSSGTILKTNNGGTPVELLIFAASANNRDVVLNWSTATETNNSGFEIHKKESGVRSQESEWEKIGFVPGHGTTTETQNYTFTDNDVRPGKSQYKLKQIDYDGTFEYSQIVEVEIPFINKFSLSQNYPNPFNPSTVISYRLPVIGFVTLKVYDLLGREIATLVNEEKPAGEYEVEFDGSNLTSGIYFYQLKAGSFIETKKMILIK